MDKSRRRRGGAAAKGLVGFGLLVVGMTGVPAQAEAAPHWKCRASAVHASINGNNRVEPIIANGNPNTAGGASADRAQCVNGDAGADNLATPLGIGTEVLSARSAMAKTTITPELGKAIDQKIEAVAKIENLSLPLGGSTVVIGAQAAEATVTGSCVNGQAELKGTSQMLGLTLGGTAIPLDDIPAALQQILAPLNVIVDVKFNEQVREGRSLTVRAAHIRVLPSEGAPPLADVVIAEAKGDSDADVCDPAKQGEPTDPGDTIGEVCPKGSVYDSSRNLCVIQIGGGGGSGTGGVIVVGLPYQGPSGGSVLPLDEARQKYGNTPCLRLKGAGLKDYVVVGTNGADKITGTNGRDRMLGLGGKDSLDGGRGSDCIEGGSGSDRTTGGIGSDRMYGQAGGDTLTGNLDNDYLSGGNGNDHLNGGPGKDRLVAGAGHDTLNPGFNADVASAGPGNDKINVAVAGPAAKVNCGTGRDKVRFNRNERRKLKGCEMQYMVR